MSLTDYVIMPGADYKDACDAVREKTGGTEPIKSGEMGGLIRGISGASISFEDNLVNLASAEIETVNADVFSNWGNLKSVDFPNAIVVGEMAFQECRALSFVNLPKVKYIHPQAFEYTIELKAELEFPVCELLYFAAFYASGVTKLSFPSVTAVDTMAFQNCRNLETVEFGAVATFYDRVFVGASSLKAVIFRTTAGVCVATPETLTDSPLLTGGAFVYIPTSMWDAYAAAYGDYMAIFRKIEDYPEICG